MTIKIRLPYSTTASALPTAGNLLTGELAINTADQKIYVKDTATVKQLIGAQGTQGSTGNVGNAGPLGSPGTTGPRGAQGGSQGPTGFPGSNGPTGVQGPTGTQGTQGTQGPQGFTGATTGPQGSQGTAGSSGPPGATGPQGAQGPQGLQGFNGNLGPLGATGPQGTAGPTGAQGAQSATPGPTGFPGPAGLLGAQGAQGTQGPQSAVRGTQGPTGPTGPTGFTGRTGFQGAAGTFSPAPVSCTTCFLGSSYTTMADGSRKMIKDVKIGDWLMGAFGEANQVLASEDLTLGERPMFIINYTHHTTSDHPHVTPDKGFVVIDPAETLKEWGQWFPCFLEDGSYVMLNNIGLDNAKDRIGQMYVGDLLQTIEGPKKVECIDSYDLPPDTKLYNFVMSGSHTYSVDGYFVTGWPRDDDFDYTNWKQIGETSKVEAWMEAE